MDYDLLIVNGIIKTFDASEKISSPGFVAINGDRIIATGPMPDLPKAAKTTKTINAENTIIMPGLVNTHNHCAMSLFRGLADDLPLTTWLQEHIFPAEANHVSREMVYWCTKLAAAEMIMSGTTTVADGYFFEDDAAQALKDSGMRGVAAQGVIDFPAPGVPDPSDNIEAATEFIKRWQHDSLITPGVFCHSPYTCSSQTIRKAKELARESGCHFFIHVAETSVESEDIKKKYGVSPVSYLDQLGVLDNETVCVHCIWLDDLDIEILKKSGASVSSCPESNMKLAAGIAPLTKIISAGIPVGLGTDGCASNNNLDLFGEMDMAAKIHKATTLDPTVLPARLMVEMATRSGAAILGLNDISGEISPGMKADIILLDLNNPSLTPLYDIDSLLTYTASGADVKTTIINGRLVMENRQLLTIDLAETIARVNSLASEVRPTL